MTQIRAVRSQTAGACLATSSLPCASRRLPIPVRMGDGETVTSFAGRIAQVNGYGRLQEFCSDQQIRLLNLTNGNEAEVEQVAALAGGGAAVLLEHTPLLVEDGWFVLGRERIKFTAFLRMGSQVCPACLAEDRAHGAPQGGYQRGLWPEAWRRS